MSAITTHVLDTTRGRPAANVEVVLSMRAGEGWRELARASTDADGRVSQFPGLGLLEPTTYRLRFETGAYFRAQGVDGFWSYVEIAFAVGRADERHHVPLLLSPFGYATYRGS